MGEILKLSYSCSPIKVLKSEGYTHRLEMDLGNGISAIESFPATENEGRYELELNKEVDAPENVDKTEYELSNLIRNFGLVWQFAGGARMDLRKMTVMMSINYKSNATEILESLLKQRGETRFCHSLCLPICYSGTYHDFPLKSAFILVNAMNNNFHLRLMLDYLNEAYIDHHAWFIHLYKVMDLIKTTASIEKQGKLPYSILKKDWKTLEKLLNTNDLRHAPKKESQKVGLSNSEINKLKSKGRNMIIKYLDYLGLPHVP